MMCKYLKRICYGFTLLILAMPIFAEESPVNIQLPGEPFINTINPVDFGFEPNCFNMLLSKSGYLYVGNLAGIIEYDGVDWKLLAEGKPGLSIAMDSSGTLFLGSVGEVGHLVPQANGELQYQSLMDKIPSDKRFFATVKYACATTDAVYFCTTRYLFRWQQNKMSVWTSKSNFEFTEVIDNELYTRQKGLGLSRIVGDSLQIVRDKFGNPLKTSNVITELNDSTFLFNDSKNNLHTFDGKEVRPFPTDVDNLLKDDRVRSVNVLSDKKIAICTLSKGLILLNPDGSLNRILNESNGLPYNNVYQVLEDKQGGVWASHFRGLSRLQLFSPISFLSQLEDLGSVFDLMVHNNSLYVAGSGGIYFKKNINLPVVKTYSKKFEKIKGDLGSCHDLLSTFDGILSAGPGGIFHINEDGSSRRVGGLNRAVELYASKVYPGRVYAGLIGGLAVLEHRDGRWQERGKVDGISGSVHNIVEDNEGYLWLGAAFREVLKLENQPGNPFPVLTRRYGSAEGVTDRFFIDWVDDKIILKSPAGLKSFKPETDRFEPEFAYGNYLTDPDLAVRRLRKDSQGNLWAYFSTGGPGLTAMAERNDKGIWEWDRTVFQRLPPFQRRWTSFLSQPNGVCWFGGVNGVTRYDPAKRNLKKIIPSLRFRRIFVNGDSLMWEDAAGKKTHQQDIEMPYSQNQIQFEYALPWFDGFQNNRYRFQLEGFDRDWSDWQATARKEYTNLSEGRYSFRVQARNVYGDLSEEALLSFTILPPWYRTLWAYAAYFLAAVFFLIGFSRFRVRQLKQKTVELESIVTERTIELREQKDQVEAQAEQLREMDKYKSRFFTNISHEFRTPLTLILGPLEDMLAKAGGASEKMNLGLMQRNGRRLLQLINQLLDLSRLESGRLTLEVQQGNLARFMRGLVMSFASLAEKRELQLQLDIDSDEQFHSAWFDADKIEKIIVNLLSNAFRFTEAGGQVQVWLKKTGKNAEIAVRDTGQGIPEEQLERIFERFHSELSGRGAFDGSGVGLSLTKEMISMHHGSIHVESSEGEGSCFIFQFPIHRKAYSDEEIAGDQHSTASEDPERITERDLLEDETETSRQSSTDSSSTYNEDAPLLLIIDDNSDVRQYVGAQLTEYTLLKAQDGQRGLEVATEHLPDLVISDVMMPEMDGYEFCEKLKTNEKTCHIPVILLTAKADEGDRLEGLETGADDYLTKPFNAKELRTRVSNLIDNRRKLREIFRREGILQPKDIPATSMEEAFLRKLVELVERELTTEEFGPEILSRELGMSSRQLQRKIKALTGQTPSDFIRSQRLQRARILLEKRSGTVSEIAYEVGFNNLSYFARSFRKEFGVAPSELLTPKK